MFIINNMITVRTQVKDIMKEAAMENMSGDFIDKLDEKVKQLILDAIRRAKEKGRRKVMGKDI